jgi:hypothetical protein
MILYHVSLNLVCQGLRRLHRIDKRRVALEAVGSSLADLNKEVVEGDAKHQHLQNLGSVRMLFSRMKCFPPLTEFM